MQQKQKFSRLCISNSRILISLVINLRMKKQLLAYTRQSKGSNREHSQESIPHNQPEPNKNEATIYNAILGQMESNHSEYINKLLVKQERQQRDDKTPKNNLNKSVNTHERTKSYTNIIIENMTTNGQTNPLEKNDNSKLKRQKSGDKKYIKSNIFFSHKNSPVTGKFMPSPKQKKKKENSSKNFLNYLDSYISVISTDNSRSSDERRHQRSSQERKTISKSKQNNSYYQILKKLESSEKKIKDLKLNNHILKIEETKQRKKNRQLKQKLHDMLEHMRKLTNDLERERYERKKMQSFFKQFQQRFTMMCPQRKTIGYKSAKRSDQFLLDENTTQQDQEFDMFLTKQMQISESKSKSSRKHSGSKTYKFHKNIQNIQEFNDESSDSLFIPKHFQDSDEGQFPYK